MVQIFPKKFKFLFLISLIIFLTIQVQTVLSDTAYISDQLVVNLKDTIAQPNITVGRVHSGDKVDILETKDNHQLIRMENGQEGWIKKQYLVSKKPTAVLVKELESRNKLLQEQLTQKQKEHVQDLDNLRNTLDPNNSDTSKVNLLKKIDELKAMTRERDTLLEKNSTLEQSLRSLNEDKSQFQQRQGEITSLQAEKEKLSAEIATLKSSQEGEKQMMINGFNIDSRVLWFISGAIVLLLGLFIGRIDRRKQKSRLSF